MKKAFFRIAGFCFDCAVIAILLIVTTSIIFEICCVLVFGTRLSEYVIESGQPYVYHAALFLSYFVAGTVFYLFRGRAFREHLDLKYTVLQMFLAALFTFLVSLVWVMPENICEPPVENIRRTIYSSILYLPLLVKIPKFYYYFISVLLTPVTLVVVKNLSDRIFLNRKTALRNNGAPGSPPEKTI